jgi:hypothetical protein
MSVQEPKTPSRAGLYIVLAVLTAAVVAAAYFQEQLGYVFQLRMWDRGAPTRTVVEFLSAVKKGDQTGATSLLEIEGVQPLEEDSKWVGFRYVAQNTPFQVRLSDITPPGEPAATRTELLFKGRGAARVFAPGKDGASVRYRLVVSGGRWKITEIDSPARP